VAAHLLCQHPVRGFGAVAAILLVPRSRDLMARVRFDWAGLGVSSRRWWLSCRRSRSGGAGLELDLIVFLFVVAAVLGGVFIWHERRDRDPMLDLGLFRNGRFSTGIASGVASYLVMFACCC